MPIFYQQFLDEHTQIAIWQIAEAEDFFLQRVPLKRDVNHPHKRLQHLAGRFILAYLHPDFPLHEILIADTRKPFLPNEKHHFSISHCEQYAAAIVSSTNRVGVDIEMVTPKLEALQHKFLSGAEWQLAVNSWQLTYNTVINSRQYHLQTILWSCKEAIFKWYGYGGVDFKKHMQFTGIMQINKNGELQLLFDFVKELPKQLLVKVILFDGLVLAWVVGDL
jgi:phosphopantetheinyl transferase